jgi:exonuclease SbcD
MKFLHTSDWHVGKTLWGRSRLAEQVDVLGEIVALARTHSVDAVLIAGDLYDSAAPTAEAQRLVVRTLLALADTGAEVIALAGNHDSPGMLDAYRPLAEHAGITLIGQPRHADEGGVVSFTARSSGERVNIAALPFLSQRWAIRAADLLLQTPAENANAYDEQIRALLDHLKTGWEDGAVHLVMAHLTVANAVLGGGERSAQTIFDYWVPATAFGADPHYVALGHLHKRQTLPAACPVSYCGSPIAVDFGDQENTQVAVLVEVTPTTPAQPTDLPITSARRLRTVRGTVAELAERAEEFGEDLLRVYLTEPIRAGLRDDLHKALPNAVQIRIDPEFAEPADGGQTHSATPERSPAELFAAYCAERNVRDPRITALFDELHDQLTRPEEALAVGEASN